MLILFQVPYNIPTQELHMLQAEGEYYGGEEEVSVPSLPQTYVLKVKEKSNIFWVGVKVQDIPRVIYP